MGLPHRLGPAPAPLSHALRTTAKCIGSCFAPSYPSALQMLLPWSSCYLLAFPHQDTPKSISMSSSPWIFPHPWHSLLFLPMGFHIPLCKHHSSSLALYCTFPASLRICLTCYNVTHLWVGATSHLSLYTQSWTEGLESSLCSISLLKKVVKGKKIFIIYHNYSIPIYSCNHRLIHKMNMNGVCCFLPPLQSHGRQ